MIDPVPSLLTRSLLTFKAANPSGQLSIDAEASDTLIPHLIQEDLDVVLGRLPDQLNTQDLIIDFFEKAEQMSVITRPGHELAGKPKIRPEDLFRFTWVLHPIGSPMRNRVETALRKTKVTAKLDIIETASLLAITSLIEASDMISIVPSDVATHYAKYGMVHILPIWLPIPMVNLGIVTRKSSTYSPAVLKFLVHLKQNM